MMRKRNGHEGRLKRRLSAYSLAAGAAIAAGGGTELSAGMAIYDNGGLGWFDSRPHFGGTPGGYDMILFTLDGTVLVDDAQIDGNIPATGSFIEIKGSSYNQQYAWGDGKTRDSAYLRVQNAGIVGTWWSAAGEAVKLTEAAVDATSTFTSGDPNAGSNTPPTQTDTVGLYGYGWYTVVGGFGGRGYMGFYMDDTDGRHYGWADLHVSGARNEITLYSIAVQTTPGVGAYSILSYPPGDFTRDGAVDDLDIDRIYRYIAIGSGLNDAEFDVDGDSDVDEDDVTYLIELLAGYDSDGDGNLDGYGTWRGDFNFDGAVTGTDLSILAGSFGLSVPGYGAGNANGVGPIDGTDLSIVASNFGQSVTGAIPEPATLSLLALGATGLMAHRRRQ